MKGWIDMDMNWANVFNWMMLLKCFVTGGIICIIGQILIDKTKLTPAKILVIFVTATVPLTGFGYNLAKGAIEAVKETGLVGAFTGGVKAAAGGIAAAVFFGYLAALISKPKMKKQ